MHSVAGWGGRAETEQSGALSWRRGVLTREAFVTFTGKQRCFLTHQPWCFCIPLGVDAGIFQKKQALDTLVC